MAGLPKELIWSPRPGFHDPNPPITIENSSRFELVGSSTAELIGHRRRVARCVSAFLYTPPSLPDWAGSLRREPAIGISTSLNSPDASSFRDEDEPIMGQDVQLDLGAGIIMGGVVQSTELTNDGDAKQSWAWNARIADYMFVLNRKRPFGCFTDQSASAIIASIWASYGPHSSLGFTTDIEANLPTLTVSFDGSRTFEECCSVVSRLIGGAKFKVTAAKVFIFKFDDPVLPTPAPLDDANEDLMVGSLRFTKDSSQLRNRVFVRGAGARVMQPTAVGATEIEIDGLDVFNPNGGVAIIGCDVFTYTGTNTSLIYPPVEKRVSALEEEVGITPETPTFPSGSPGVSWTDAEEGPICTRVRYTCSWVINGKETERTPFPTHATPEQVRPGTNWAGGFPGVRQVVPGAGFATGNAVMFGHRTHSGKLVVREVFSVGFASAFNATPSKHIYGPYPSQGVNTDATGGGGFDPRVAELVIFRQKPTDIGGVWWEVDGYPIGTDVPIDVKDDASLGRGPSWRDDAFNGGRTVNDSGSRVFITNVSQLAIGVTEVKIYREENFNAYTSWTTPKQVMSIPCNPNNATPLVTFPIEDTTPTSTFAWERGVNVGTPEAPVYEPAEPTNPDPSPAPPPPKPKIRLTLTGVSGLDEAHEDGEQVNIFLQVDDLPSQVATALLEGGDGIHEGYVSDTLLESDAMLLIRGNAELALWKDPILTASYITKDSDSRVGADIEVNLTEPPVVASLRIQEVSVQRVHENDVQVTELYSVTASSVKFTLEDLLRRALLRE